MVRPQRLCRTQEDALRRMHASHSRRSCITSLRALRAAVHSSCSEEWCQIGAGDAQGREQCRWTPDAHPHVRAGVAHQARSCARLRARESARRWQCWQTRRGDRKRDDRSRSVRHGEGVCQRDEPMERASGGHSAPRGCRIGHGALRRYRMRGVRTQAFVEGRFGFGEREAQQVKPSPRSRSVQV